MEEYMNFSTSILLVILIGAIASATNTNLANNTMILLLLLLALYSENSSPQCPTYRTSNGFLLY
jgi:hypothetical protein